MRKCLWFQREVFGVELARREQQPIALDESMESDPWGPARGPRSQSVLRIREVRDSSPSAPKVLVGEREHRWYIFEPERVEYIESDENYVKLHSGNAEYISRNTIKNLAVDLKGDGFVRIERSLLVNVRAILYAQRAGRGTFGFTLTSGVTLRSGATYRQEILRVLPLAPPSASLHLK
jgi:DNA-binding LytR/AlgR family response regulator